MCTDAPHTLKSAPLKLNHALTHIKHSNPHVRDSSMLLCTSSTKSTLSRLKHVRMNFNHLSEFHVHSNVHVSILLLKSAPNKSKSAHTLYVNTYKVHKLECAPSTLLKTLCVVPKHLLYSNNLQGALAYL